MPATPPWCTPPEPLLERHAALSAALAATGPVSLYGAAGVGVTVAGGAVLEALVDGDLCDRVVALRANACTRAEDLRRGLGLEIGATPPGDPLAIDAALPARVAVLVDDADLCPDEVRATVERWPAIRWILTGRVAVEGAAPVEVARLSDEALATLLPAGTEPARYLGLPLLAKLPRAPEPGRPFAAVDALPPGAELLAELPMGRPTPRGAVQEAWHLPIAGRIVFRRSVREALSIPAEPSSEALAAGVRDRLSDAHHLACDAVSGASIDDLVLYRTSAARIADPDLAVLAGAAAARLLLRFLDPDAALTLTRGLAAERAASTPTAVGLLRWLEADALLDLGYDEEAAPLHRSAAESLERAREHRVVSALARRCADRMAERGDGLRAGRWLADARRFTPALEDPVAWSDTLRIAGDLAAAAGELVGASALYDEALAALSRVDGGVRTRAAVRLGQASLEIARGQHDVAAQHLDEASHVEDPLLLASVAWRRAEIAARRGRPEDARPWLGTARSGFASAGSSHGLALCWRLQGDVEALSGDRVAALAHWRTALVWASRDRDLAATRRILRRILAVEREGTPGTHLEALQARLDLVEVLLRVR